MSGSDEGRWDQHATYDDMKLLISDNSPYLFDFDAPTVPAYERRCPVTGRLLWTVWCKHCERWHWPGEGHREAHYQDSRSPYEATGYNLAHAGGDDGTTE